MSARRTGRTWRLHQLVMRNQRRRPWRACRDSAPGSRRSFADGVFMSLAAHEAHVEASSKTSAPHLPQSPPARLSA